MPEQENAGKVFSRLMRMLRPHYRQIGLGLALLILSMPGELFPAFAWMYVVDELITEQDSFTVRAVHYFVSFNGAIARESEYALLISCLAWMLVIYVVFEAMETLSSNVMQRVAERFIRDLRRRVYSKLQTQSLSYLQRQKTGDLMSRALSDVDELRSFITGGIDVIIGEGLLWVATVVIVMLLDWRVASVSLAPLLVVYVLLRIFNAKVAPIYKSARESSGRVSSRLQENLSGVVVIKIFGREKQEAQRFGEATEENYQQQVKAINARTVYFPVTRAVGFLSNIFMIGVGGWSILSGGSFTLGKLLAFRAYWWRLFGPVQTLARVNDMVQRAIASCRRIFEVLDAPDELPDVPDARRIDAVDGRMALESVSFSYRGAGSQPAEKQGLAAHATDVVLKDVTIEIPAGQTVALVGPSGAGKSTVLNLLLRFYDPTSGVVSLDGHDLRSLARDSFRRHIALVQQESFLFNESILDNIRYGHGEAGLEDVERAAKAANAHGFISRMPKGYDTIVGERGVRLSGGQKQRISIARAFLANPRVLLLDEPTSSVEPDSEAAIIAAIDRLMVGRTTVLTSHRPSLVQQASLVYVIEEGRVTASGPVEQVRTQNAWFDRFMRSAEEVSEDVAP
jgi:ABC-type multidrug transport system fused ATPase/permease subunit